MTEILVLEKPEEKLRRERERLLGELSVYGERLAVLQETVDEIKEIIECYDEAIENLGTDHAKKNTKTLRELFDDMGKAFGGMKTKTAGQYLDEIYYQKSDLFRRLRSAGYDYLARDKNGGLYAYRSEVYKVEEISGWDNNDIRDGVYIRFDNFPEVKWSDEEPTKISKLLATYENGGENGKQEEQQDGKK